MLAQTHLGMLPVRVRARRPTAVLLVLGTAVLVVRMMGWATWRYFGAADEEIIADAAAIVVTHDDRDVRALASTVFVMERGRIIQRGTPAQIAARPASAFVAEFFDVADARGAHLGGDGAGA